uniref:Rna-directed dna polymerase from mobile element jockey-like n=1 Tax=Haemonchus contortus TaxID=6289 RepID=A0A7I4YBN1_HAECO
MEPANELDVDVGSITSEETIEAIRCLRSGRASGIDDIPSELLKAGGSTMMEKLMELYNRCWSGLEVPEDWRKGVIVKLPEKGNLADCENWKVTLLSVPGKALCVTLLR